MMMAGCVLSVCLVGRCCPLHVGKEGCQHDPNVAFVHWKFRFENGSCSRVHPQRTKSPRSRGGSTQQHHGAFGLSVVCAAVDGGADRHGGVCPADARAVLPDRDLPRHLEAVHHGAPSHTPARSSRAFRAPRSSIEVLKEGGGLARAQPPGPACMRRQGHLRLAVGVTGLRFRRCVTQPGHSGPNFMPLDVDWCHRCHLLQRQERTRAVGSSTCDICYLQSRCAWCEKVVEKQPAAKTDSFREIVLCFVGRFVAHMGAGSSTSTQASAFLSLQFSPQKNASLLLSLLAAFPGGFPHRRPAGALLYSTPGA